MNNFVGNLAGALSPYRWIALAVTAAALVASVIGYGEWRADQATTAESQRWELATTKLKAEAATTLATETRRVLALERDLAEAQQLQEKQFELRRTEAKGYEARLADLVRAGNGRLRDPKAQGCRCGSGGAPGATAASAGRGDGDGADASGLLSADLTGLLQRLQRKADEVNNAYSICRADAIQSRQSLTGRE